jgi:hypothetical protein
VNELLQQKAYFYVCGDAANMAREVNTVLAQIIAEQRNIPESKGEEIVKSMRSANQYQVWFFIYIAYSTEHIADGWLHSTYSKFVSLVHVQWTGYPMPCHTHNLCVIIWVDKQDH